MTWLFAIICIILVVIFWRIFLPLALIAAVGLGLILLNLQVESQRSESKKKQAEQTVRQRIANAKAAAGDVVRQWEVRSETDPASGEEVPRYASVSSDDGLCRIQVEQRINGDRLTGIYCSGLKISTYPDDIEIKFDNRSMSDPMKIAGFSDGDDVYISSFQYKYSRYLTYDEFLRRITGAKKVSLLLTVEGAGQHWITFSLIGSTPALTKIGAVSAGDSGTQRSSSRKSDSTRRKPEDGITPNLPANAKLNVLGNDWECVRGYRRSGSECIGVQLPPNAKLNVFGNDWECQRGYRQSGSECVAVHLPANGKLNVFGNDWECVRGYRQIGNECGPVAGSPPVGR